MLRSSYESLWEKRNGKATDLPVCGLLSKEYIPLRAHFSYPLDGPAHLSPLPADSKKMLSNDPARDPHDLGDLPLGLSMEKVKMDNIALSWSQFVLDDVFDLPNQEIESVLPLVSDLALFIRLVPKPLFDAKPIHIQWIYKNLPKMRSNHRGCSSVSCVTIHVMGQRTALCGQETKKATGEPPCGFESSPM